VQIAPLYTGVLVAPLLIAFLFPLSRPNSPPVYKRTHGHSDSTKPTRLPLYTFHESARSVESRGLFPGAEVKKVPHYS